MIYTKLSSEIKQLEDNLNNTNTDYIILSGELGSGKSLLLKQYQDYLWRKDQNAYTIFFRFQPATGLIPQLLNLENQITNLVNKKSGEYRLLAESLRSKLSGDNLVTISGKHLSELEIAELFKKSLLFVSAKLKKEKLLLLLDLSDIHDSRYDERMLGILRKIKIDNIKIVIATNQVLDEKKIHTTDCYLHLDTNNFLLNTDFSIDVSQESKTIVLKIWHKHKGNLLVLDTLIRFLKIFGKDVTKKELNDLLNITGLDGFITLIAALMWQKFKETEKMLLMGVSCSLKPLTKSDLGKAINWDNNYLGKVLSEQPHLANMFDTDLYNQGVFSIYHSYLKDEIIALSSRSQIGLIHKRLVKNHLHINIEDYWTNPEDIGISIFHLLESDSPEIVNFLLLSEIKTLSRLWGLSDIMVDALRLAIEKIPSYKQSTVSLNTENENEVVLLRIGEEDKKNAAFSLYREYAYYLEINMRQSEASDNWNKALAALDLSEINTKERAKLKALLWGDIAQLRFEEDKLLEAMEALETQIGYIKQSDIRGNILAATWHNLGMIQLRLNQFIAARKSFEEALSYSEKNSVQAIDDLVQIANTWRIAGNFENAIAFFQNAVTYAEALGSIGDYMRAVALGNLALCQYEKGELEAANRNIIQARSLFVSLNALDDLSAAEELIREIRKRQNK